MSRGTTRDSFVRFDRKLVAKYDIPGPRYTSYPAAPFFEDGFSRQDQLALYRESRESGRPLSLYLHVPFCKTRCLFCGCNVVIARDPARADAYLDLLIREIGTVAEAIGSGDRTVEQLHWGGGTPNFLDGQRIDRLADALRQSFTVDSAAEISVEIDPRSVREDQLDAFSSLGVNRVSLGVQDLDPRVQQEIRRMLPSEELEGVVRSVRTRGVEGINLDLIYGLPHQTAASFEATLDRILELRPDRLAVYNFAYLPERFVHQRALDSEALPDSEERLSILELTVEKLTREGYRYLGLDHFARPEDPLVRALDEGTMTRSFQGYTTHGHCDLVGLGVSSIGRLTGGFVQNQRELNSYGRAIDEEGLAPQKGLRLEAEDHLRGEVIESLLCRLRVEKEEISRRHGIDFDSHFSSELDRLEPLRDDGLVETSPEAIELTERGQLVARVVAMVFDEYLDLASTRFSRVV